jgi:hypothetical protein
MQRTPITRNAFFVGVNAAPLMPGRYASQVASSFLVR